MKYVNNKNNFSWSKAKQREYDRLVDDIQTWKDEESMHDYWTYIDEYGGEYYESVWDGCPNKVQDDWNFWQKIF